MQTPFEISGVKSTRAEGEAFLTALAAATDVVVTDYGDSVWGLPMLAATIGAGPVQVAVIASIHGSEPAPREAAFKFLRDLAETADSGLLSYLASNAWSFMCTANPDKIDAGSRLNANGIDLNRDYLAQTQPETQAIAAWLNFTDPVLILDLHETTNAAIPDTATVWSTHPDIHTALSTRSDALEDVVSAALIAAGNDWVPYPFDTDTVGTATTEGCRIWKASALVTETRIVGSKTLTQRVDEHMVSIQAARGDHETNAAAYEAAHIAAGGEPPPDPEPPTQSQDYRVRVAGVTVQPLSLRLRVAGVTSTIWQPVP